MTDTDKELARQWALNIPDWAGKGAEAASRYILATLADDRDARIEALKQQLHAEENDHRADVERLTSELATERERHAAVIDDFTKQKRIVQKEREEVARLTKESIQHNCEILRLRSDVERLTKERDEAKRGMAEALVAYARSEEKPAAEDAELDNVAQCLRDTLHGQGFEYRTLSDDTRRTYLNDYLDTMQQLVLLLAARVKEMRR